VPRWAKLSERIGQDGRLAEVAEANPLAALFFTWGLAAADVYGILPGDPREYRARVAGAMQTPLPEVADAIAAQVEAGLITAYQDGDTALLYIHHYHDYQDVRWSRVGPPEYRLPDSWTIPGALLEWLGDPRSKQAHKTAAYYGLRDGQLVNSGSGPGLSGSSRDQSEPDTEPDTDTDTEPDTDTETDHPPPTPPTAGAHGKASPPARTTCEDYGSTDGLRSDLGAVKQNYPNLNAACWSIAGWAPTYKDRLFQDLVTAIQHPTHWLRDEAMACALLKEFEPEPEEKWLPAKWLERMKTEGHDEPAEPWDPDLGYLKGEERRIRKLQLERQRQMNEEEAERERSRTVPAE